MFCTKKNKKGWFSPGLKRWWCGWRVSRAQLINATCDKCHMFSIRYQLLLTRHKSLKTRGHTKSQLIYEGRLILAVDLNFDARLVRGFICRETLNKIIYRAGDLMSTASRHKYNDFIMNFIITLSRMPIHVSSLPLDIKGLL